MSVQKAYDEWSLQYDTNVNRTRDMEAIAIKETLAHISFETCLEIGCGTGKNTNWLLTKAKSITAVDMSAEMLAKAKEKINTQKVNFIQADILKNWDFGNSKFNLISFNLVLEHIEDLELVFKKAFTVLAAGGYLYIGELHPFKQYTGSKARFTTDHGEQVVSCFTHHVSDFIIAAKRTGLKIITLNEYFDEDNRHEGPRILSILFKAEDL
jgi:ubiquinone/menaquinone biosynthesis C-methylase UbiE